MDNISDIGSPLSERSRTPFFDGGGISLSGLPFEEALVARIGEPLVLGVEPSISEPAVVEPTAAECRESAVLALAAFTADDFSEMSGTDSTSTFAADSEGRMLPVGEIPRLGGFFQTAANSEATVISGASVDTPTLASIFSEIVPCPPTDIFKPPERLEADRQKADRAPSSPGPQLPQTTFDFTMEPNLPTNQNPAEESSAPQEPSTPGRNTPETPQRGWNLRGLLSSVPRSFSRLLPFGRPSESSEDQSGPQTEGRSRWRLSEGPSQPPKKRARNLSYSLFPAPIDRSLYLGDIPKPSTAPTEAAAPDSHRTEQVQAQKPGPVASDDQAERRQTSQAISDAEQRKRKRSPSPDVIPNPAGSSYGLDLDYFCYSSESEDEAAETPSKQSERKKADSLAKSVARSALRTERQSSKKVRFDASPEDTPSKLRSRARSTDPYRGTHFVGMGSDSPTPPARTEQPSQRHAGFVPNTQGTFQLDYDAVSDEFETSSLSSSTDVTAPSPSQAAREEDGRASTQPEGHDAQSPASRHTSRAQPSTPGKVDEEALARVRSQAEKYKPKTPSGLRTTSRYASPLTATPDIVASKQTTKKSDLSPQPGKADEPGNFGDDEFARDAEWLYQNCPSGDLSQLKWPARQSYEESLGVSSTSMKLLATIWDDSEIEPAYLAFRQSFEEFKKTLK
ncbi:unnamed protein product [Aspergillus oryzae]|nr:unnamed protein product [Aspergillus oryzae]GMF84878.1 unnamed protein product [Aspergillus oryzae]